MHVASLTIIWSIRGQDPQLQARKETARSSAETQERTRAATKGSSQERCVESTDVNLGPTPSDDGEIENDSQIIAATQRWLEKAVIGLNLCPFAAGAHLRKQIRYTVSSQQRNAGLVIDLAHELRFLHDTDPVLCETSLLIHPQVLTNFRDYNEFLDEADDALRDLGFEGELQIASFHPQYQFADSAPDDIENYTNRSPYPMLHLLRETSVTRAVQTYPGVLDIADRNRATLRNLGKAGWQRLL